MDTLKPVLDIMPNLGVKGSVQVSIGIHIDCRENTFFFLHQSEYKTKYKIWGLDVVAGSATDQARLGF